MRVSVTQWVLFIPECCDGTGILNILICSAPYLEMEARRERPLLCPAPPAHHGQPGLQLLLLVTRAQAGQGEVAPAAVISASHQPPASDTTFKHQTNPGNCRRSLA